MRGIEMKWRLVLISLTPLILMACQNSNRLGFN